MKPKWWTVECKALDGIGNAIEIESDNETIAHIYPAENMQERADLFAAAPDMLAALKALLVAIDCGKHEATLEKSNPLCVSVARAAIARAEGSTP